MEKVSTKDIALIVVMIILPILSHLVMSELGQEPIYYALEMSLPAIIAAGLCTKLSNFEIQKIVISLAAVLFFILIIGYSLQGAQQGEMGGACLVALGVIGVYIGIYLSCKKKAEWEEEVFEEEDE